MWSRDERFSEGTLVALIEAAANAWSHQDLNFLLRRLGVDDADDRQSGSLSKAQRMETAVDRLSSRGPQHGQDVLELARCLIEDRWDGRLSEYFLAHNEPARRLIAGLKSDGWEVANGRLVASTPDVLPLAEEVTLLETELKARGWEVAVTHYRQAVTNYRDNEFESSNGQLRNVLEESLQQSCAQRTGRAGRDPKGSADRLANANLITNDEAALLKALVGISNSNGAHPGLSNADEALFRMHMIVATVRWLLAVV